MPCAYRSCVLPSERCSNLWYVLAQKCVRGPVSRTLRVLIVSIFLQHWAGPTGISSSVLSTPAGVAFLVCHRQSDTLEILSVWNNRRMPPCGTVTCRHRSTTLAVQGGDNTGFRQRRRARGTFESFISDRSIARRPRAGTGGKPVVPGRPRRLRWCLMPSRRPVLRLPFHHPTQCQPAVPSRLHINYHY